MARRWWIPLMTLPVVAGSMLAAGAASALPLRAAQHTAVHHRAAAQAVRPGSPMIRPLGATLPSVSNGLNSTATSMNWSGYAAVGGRGAFRSVSASWTQPAANCKGVVGHRLAAFWVGLDGFSSLSVEQTGTDSDCRGKNPTYYGWYEMFPASPVFYRTTVRPGDHISASVTFRGPATYTLVLRDVTRRWTHTIVKNGAGLARSSAEVITEAPSSNTGVLPLADFGVVRFTSSRVNGALLRNVAPVRIIMVDGSRLDKDLTSLIGTADAFANTWLRSF